MHVRPILFIILLIACLSACKNDTGNYQAILPSPDFDVHVYFQLHNGYPYYMAYYRQQRIFDWSAMGFKPKNGVLLDRDMNLSVTEKLSNPMETGSDAHGFFTDRKFNTLLIDLQSSGNESTGYTIEFRTFKDGFAFRYILFPGMDIETILPSERTEFVLTNRKRFQRIEMTDTASIILNKRFRLPVHFMSGQNEEIEILELENNWPFRMQITQKEEDKNVYLSSVIHSGKIVNESERFRITPWRVVRINNVDASVEILK